MNARLRAKRNFWIQTSAVLLLFSLLTAAYIRSATSPIDSEELSIETSDLRSLCAAGAELSKQFSTGNLTATFFYEQLDLMHEKITTAREKLDAAQTDTEIPSELDRARKLAASVDIEFDKLSTDEHGGSLVRQELTDLIGPLKQLEEQLKQGADK
jgi:hypothetical protein